MPREFVTYDVFTDRQFGGNWLAVIPDAKGLSAEAMQTIAFEFNYPETTFVLPAKDPANTAEVRIFTPMNEMPFAGHPNIGTAVALADLGMVGPLADGMMISFEEKAGLVPIRLSVRDGRAVAAELTAPVINDLRAEVAVADIAAATGLVPDDIITDRHRPRIVSSGPLFLYAELASRASLAAAHRNMSAIEALTRRIDVEGLFVYTADTAGLAGVDFAARMFAPIENIPEDPATGSANVGLANLLALSDPRDGTLIWRVAQGEEMGRPSRLTLTAEKADGKVSEIRVAGGAMRMMSGVLEI